MITYGTTARWSTPPNKQYSSYWQLNVRKLTGLRRQIFLALVSTSKRHTNILAYAIRFSLLWAVQYANLMHGRTITTLAVRRFCFAVFYYVVVAASLISDLTTSCRHACMLLSIYPWVAGSPRYLWTFHSTQTCTAVDYRALVSANITLVRYRLSMTARVSSSMGARGTETVVGLSSLRLFVRHSALCMFAPCFRSGN